MADNANESATAKLRRAQVTSTCDCGHGYTDHAFAMIDGVYTGGGACKSRAKGAKCACTGFQSDATRAIKAGQALPETPARERRSSAKRNR